MKKLEELGISPAPWKFIPRDEIGGDVKCSWRGIARKRHHTVVVRDAYIADARLIAAAPELYKKAYETAENLLVHLAVPTQTITMNRAEIVAMAKDLLAALAEATGENETKK